MLGAARKRAGVGSVALIGLLATAPALAAASSADLLPLRSAARLQSIATLSAGAATSSPCLTPVLQVIRTERQRATALNRRAFATLVNDPTLPGERLAVDPDGTTVRFTVDRTAADRIEATDENVNGRPDVVDEVLSGAARAQHLLIDQLELPSPGSLEIVLSRLGSNIEGVSIPVPGRQAKNHIWLDASAVRTTSSSLRRAAEHQYAHAVAAAVGLDPAWGEAFATWTVLALEGSPDDRTLAQLAARLAAANTGLITQDFDLASGNAAWFAFLNDSYGPTAVKLAIEELGRGGSDQAALDRATRRATGSPLDAALRDFQLWTLLVGPRDDGKHFSFASKLPAPTFAASAEAFPALSVQAEPEVGPMGHAAILLHPDEISGGLTIRFEGDAAARWGADLLLVRANGALRRVPVVLDADDASELSIPVQDVREVLLLVRNLDPEGRPARRYSWSAQFEAGFPAEFGTLRAEPAGNGGGALVSWDTATERGLLGFNVLRSRADRAGAVRVNPVWIPSVGESSGPAAYSFFDAGAEPGVAYRYEIEAVTLEGLTSRSEAVPLAPTPY